MSAVFKTKLRPRFIGPFTVVDKNGLAYTLNLLRKLLTHPGFYVGLFKPYRDLSQVDWEALAPRKLVCHRLLHPNQEVKLHLHPCLTRFKRRQESLHRVKRSLVLAHSLAETVHLLN